MKDAKGHGSNKRGIHASMVEQVGNVQLHPNVLNTIRKSPLGFSVMPTNGKSPTDGFMVALPGHSRIVPEKEMAGPRGLGIVAEYAKANAAALQQPGAHIGGWTDKGRTYLDVSLNIKNKSAAVKAGKNQNQISIWDVKRKRAINTGGDGT
jgi:hypothetical protein